MRLNPLLAGFVPLALAQDLEVTTEGSSLTRQFQLRHRLVNLAASGSASASFADRGIIAVEGSRDGAWSNPRATYASSTSSAGLVTWDPEEPFDWDDIWYQVALSDVNGKETQSTGSIRACHLLSGGRETLTLAYLGSPSSADAPISIHPSVSAYDTTGLRCPSSVQYAKLGDISRAIESRGSQDVLVEVKTPQVMASPSLRPPPTLDPTSNKPIEPPVEKSFLAKYWVYLLGAFLAVSLVMSPEQPQEGGVRGRKR